jgi:hypothetical protein
VSLSRSAVIPAADGAAPHYRGAKVARFLTAISSRPYQGIDISAMKIETAQIKRV